MDPDASLFTRYLPLAGAERQPHRICMQICQVLLCRSSLQRIIDALAAQPSQPACGLPAVVLEVVEGSQSLPEPCSPLTLTMLQQLAEGATQHWVTAACSRLATAASRLHTGEVYEMVPCSRGGCPWLRWCRAATASNTMRAEVVPGSIQSDHAGFPASRNIPGPSDQTLAQLMLVQLQVQQ